MVDGPVAKRRIKRRTLRNAIVGGTIFIVVSVAGGMGWKVYSNMSASAAEAAAEERENRTRELARIVSANFRELTRPLKQAAKAEDTVALFQQADKSALEEAAAQQSTVIPYILKLRYLIPGDYPLDTDSIPPFSYASLDLLRSAEKTSQVNAEVLLLGTEKEHIVYIERVVNKSLELVGLIHASLSVDLLQELIAGVTVTDAYAEVIQQASGKTSKLLGIGNKGYKSGEPTTVGINDTDWVINYWTESSPGAADDTAEAGLPLIPVAAVLVFVLLALFIFMKKKQGADSTGSRPKKSKAEKKTKQDDSIQYEGAVRAIAEGAHEGVSDVIPHLPKMEKSAKVAKPLSQGMEGDDITTMPKAAQKKPAVKQQVAKKKPAPAEVKQAPEPPVQKPAIKPAAAPAGKDDQIDPVIFRTYDIRGIVGETLTSEAVSAIAKALGSMAIERGQKTLTVGRDGRESGPDLSNALIEGLLSTGINVIDVGMVPTPVLYFSTYHLDTSSGVMLTGSHNPAEYNGLKIMLGGNTLSGDDIQEIRKRTEQGEFATGKGELTQQDVNAAYIQRITEDIPVALSNSLKVVVDCGNGVAGVLAPQLIKALNHDVIEMYCEIDGSFPNHHPDPSQPENLQELIERVKTENADVGFAFDGDGDRLGIVDKEGNIIWPDRQMMLLAQDVLSRNPGAHIIYDVKCSRYLKTVIEESGGQPLMWKTGHSLIKGKMKEVEAPLAGEMSGHIFFKERWYGFDDALYTAARFLEIFMNSGKSPTDCFRNLPDGVSTPELRLPMPESEHAGFMLALIENMQQNAGGEVSDIDGVRIEYEDGWGLARPSNTSPNIVLRFEGQDQAALERIQGVFRDAVTSVKADAQLPF